MPMVGLVRTTVSACALLAVSGGVVAPSAQARMDLVQVAKDVYTMTSVGGSNSTFVVTDEGVVVFDSDIRTADQVLAAIRRTTDKKVAFIFSSHASADHSTGVWLFREDNPVYIATRDQIRAHFVTERKEFDERKAQGAAGYSLKGAELMPPKVGFDDTLTLSLGGMTFQARAEGYGHTSGDMTMFIPQRGVMLMGDLLNNEVHPGPADAGGVLFAQIQGQIDILNRILERRLPVDTYVSGHGPVHVGRGATDLVDQRDYFVLMRQEVAKMVQAGKGLEEIQKQFKVPARYASYPAGRLPGILRLFFNQLTERGQ